MSREMKDSGIEWIGETPFNVTQAKRYVSICHGSDPITEGAVPVYGSGSEIVKTCGEYKIGPCVLLGRKGTLDKPQYIEGKYWNVDTAFDARSKNNGVNIKYYYYQMLCFPFSKYSTNTALPSMTQEVYKTAGIVVPSLLEQQQIVQFLDEKCSAIDTAIEKTKKSIEKLEEYKKAVITKAVTKGIDPNAKMKDSGVEWIGEIPEGWNFVKLTFITDAKHPYPIGDGDHGLIKNDRYVEEGIPYIRVQNLGWGDELSLKNTVCITEEDNARIINSELHPGDVLFAKTGATIGKVSLVPQTISRANTTSHVGKITLCNKYLPKYILYVLSSTVAYRQLWEIAGRKATRPELSIDEIKDMRLLLTLSLKEQNEIVSYLDNKCSAIDNLITKKNETINKWEEYKKSLIYYAVTGKIDCRNEVI